MTKRSSGDKAPRSGKVSTTLELDVLDSATSTLREVLKLVIEGAEVEDLSLAERKAKELYRTALDVWAKLKERQLMRTYDVSRVDVT